MLVAAAILGVLAALLFPSVVSVMSSAHQAKCAQNMRALHVAALGYSNDNEHRIVPGLITRAPESGGRYNYTWFEYLSPYLPASEHQPGHATTDWVRNACPEGIKPLYQSRFGGNPYAYYTYSANLALDNYREGHLWWEPHNRPTRKLNGFRSPSKVFYFVDAVHYGLWPFFFPEIVFDSPGRHRGGSNYLFLDGHVEWREGPVPRPSSGMYGCQPEENEPPWGFRGEPEG